MQISVRGDSKNDILGIIDFISNVITPLIICKRTMPSTILGINNSGNVGGIKLLNPQTEQVFHYKYLKEFRVEQCPLFLQHKCQQHRPFTCFNWHFQNQKRRRPIKRKDGTFNYNADVYCTKYDETTGICNEGDE